MTKKTKASKEEAAPEKRTRRLTPKEWAIAEALWESGEVTQVDLAKKFNCTEQSVHLHMKRGGFVRGAKGEAHKKKVAEEVTKVALGDATIIAARIRETKEDHYKMASGLARLAWNEVLVSQRDKKPISASMNNLKALDAAITVISKARNERYAVLGLDKEDKDEDEGLPELLISELTADQIAELRDRDHTELEDLPSDVIDVADGSGDGVVEES